MIISGGNSSIITTSSGITNEIDISYIIFSGVGYFDVESYKITNPRRFNSMNRTKALDSFYDLLNSNLNKELLKEGLSAERIDELVNAYSGDFQDKQAVIGLGLQDVEAISVNVEHLEEDTGERLRIVLNEIPENNELVIVRVTFHAEVDVELEIGSLISF